jgi:hypothetical protein
MGSGPVWLFVLAGLALVAGGSAYGLWLRSSPRR